MSEPFRRLFLDIIERAIKQEPSHEALLALLQLATPGLDENALGDHSEKRKLFRNLLARVHPDKHPGESERATRLCQDVATFCDKCDLALPTPSRKRRKVSVSLLSRDLPLEFSSIEKWPHTNFTLFRGQNTPDEAQITRLVAYQCINARGAIVHGKVPGRIMLNHQKHGAGSAQSVEAVFASHGGSKAMEHRDEIKEEIMRRGPVVSTAFAPNEAFVRLNSNLRGQREILIVGWKQERSGEVWIASPLSSVQYKGSDIGAATNLVHVNAGQFGIDDRCVAPTSSLEHVTWERGPYLDFSFPSGCENWRTGEGAVSSEFGAVEPILKEIGAVHFSPSDGSSGGVKVCVRDKNKNAHSRRGSIKSIQWMADAAKWKVTVQFEARTSLLH